MVEHVGRSRLRDIFRRRLPRARPGGLFLNHGIAQQTPGRQGLSRRPGLSAATFSPTAISSRSATALRCRAAGFEVRDVENLREHYNRTLRAWVANLSAIARPQSMRRMSAT